jgi:hypothetical protein
MKLSFGCNYLPTGHLCPPLHIAKSQISRRHMLLLLLLPKVALHGEEASTKEQTHGRRAPLQLAERQGKRGR